MVRVVNGRGTSSARKACRCGSDSTIKNVPARHILLEKTLILQNTRMAVRDEKSPDSQFDMDIYDPGGQLRMSIRMRPYGIYAG